MRAAIGIALEIAIVLYVIHIYMMYIYMILKQKYLCGCIESLYSILYLYIYIIIYIIKLYIKSSNYVYSRRKMAGLLFFSVIRLC